MKQAIVKEVEKELGRKLTKAEKRAGGKVLADIGKAFDESDSKLQALKKLGFKVTRLK